MISTSLLLCFGAAPLTAVLTLECALQDEAASTPAVEEPAPLADAEQPHGVLRYAITDHLGHPIPGRLTFVAEAGVIPDLFPNTRVRPHDLAVRRNVVYTLSGHGAITVPVGTYSVYATRGIEYELHAEQVEIHDGEEAIFTAALTSPVSTPGWISGDFHLHTLTYSGHGDSNLEERIISLIGEGVEFAVATDHNHNTDYGPTVEALAAGNEIKTITGNEVSVPIGHLNAFPLEPDRPVPDPDARDARELFRFIRGEPNRYGITPVIQLNHPRWGDIDILTKTGLDPITGGSVSPIYSPDFDTIEVFNANEGWGYYDADVAQDFSIGSGVHSALQDWFNLLNRGHRYVAVGNSDSHTVHHGFAGYPRNFVEVPIDQPSRVQPAMVAEALREGRCYTTFGPVLDFRVNGQPLGSLVSSDSGRVLVEVRLQTPTWILVNRVKIVVNGDVVATVELEPSVRADGRFYWPRIKQVVPLLHDSWIVVLVEGDESLDPIVCGGPRPVLPLAVTNPIRVDVDGDGKWTSTLDWARRECDDRINLDRLMPGDAAFLLLAAAGTNGRTAPQLVLAGLASKERRVQLAAMRAAEILAFPAFAPSLEALWRRATDPFTALTALRALAVCDTDGAPQRLALLLDRFDRKQVQRYSSELARLLPVEMVREWQVIGYFPNPSSTTLFEGDGGPPVGDDDGAEPEGKDGPVRWIDATVSESGFVDLSAIDPERRDASISYARTYLLVDEAKEVLYTLGSDDGCRLWVGSEEVYRDQTRHGARPLQQVGKLRLAAGWNRVVIGVENGGGPTGLYFGVLDASVRASAERD